MSTKFMVRSAIDGDERLARMAENIVRDTPRLRPQPERAETLTVCGYGPSLRTTWETIDGFICTTSGAHNFMIARGKIPSWHVEYDPRERQCDFLQQPDRRVTYCLASTCHQKLFEQLQGQSVLMWHALGQNVRDDANLVAKHDDDGILLLGGSNAGLRAIMVGHVLGFRSFDLHGFDCSYQPDTVWAGPHCGEPHAAFEIECNGKIFLSSDVMINSAEEAVKMMHGLPGCTFRVFGDGLLAERFRLMKIDYEKAMGDWWRPLDKNAIKRVPVNHTIQIDAVITEQYRRQNAILHEFNPAYGVGGRRYADVVSRLADGGTVLDYGCGKASLSANVDFPVVNYDPAIAAYSAFPEPADLVVCTDVLEHIEPQCLDAVLADLKRVTRKTLFVAIACYPAEKCLPDGRNAHLLVREFEWWQGMLERYFSIVEAQYNNSIAILTCGVK